ncbi:hypothetical protein ACIGXM_03290 [Kitasatospora sp. NPDC052896]|uniref:hypothetical protein n=1 Tax=Kitasatospora sp. NPDC052896 TaxID=3364061 RepID=UPI0037CB5D82
MAENYEDNAGSTQMFRAFVETPAQQQAQAPGSVSVHRSGGGGARTGVITVSVVAVVAVVVAVVWLALS